MSWNQRSRFIAVAFALQPTAGTFVAPNTTTDLIAVSTPSNDLTSIVAQDPTATGTIFNAPDVQLGVTGNAGGTVPLRGPGGASPPAANAFVPGRILQAAGWTEAINATPITGTALAGPSANSLKLAVTENATDDFWTGAVIGHATIGTGLRAYTPVLDYIGATKMALVGDPVGTTIVAGTYTLPAQMWYTLGTQSTPPPRLSVSVWRDKKRYDYVDWRPTNLVIDVPVSNEANTSFPTMQFTGKGTPYAIADATAPQLSSATLAIPVAPARGGKFYLDRTLLGHQDLKFTQTGTVAAAPNQNADAGQDGYDILDGTRAIDLDLNQMSVSDFDIAARYTASTVVPVISTWGKGSGNNWAFSVPNIVLRPFTPGDRNGFISLTGTAQTTDVDKSASLAIWW